MKKMAWKAIMIAIGFGIILMTLTVVSYKIYTTPSYTISAFNAEAGKNSSFYGRIKSSSERLAYYTTEIVVWNADCRFQAMDYKKRHPEDKVIKMEETTGECIVVILTNRISPWKKEIDTQKILFQ